MAFGLLDERAGRHDRRGRQRVRRRGEASALRSGRHRRAGRPVRGGGVADETADAEMVAADLLGQAEHGPTSPAQPHHHLRRLAAAVLSRSTASWRAWSTRDIAGAAWRDWGSIYVPSRAKPRSRSWTHSRPSTSRCSRTTRTSISSTLRNYGSLFLGAWSTVAYADKGMSGTNHVLPTCAGLATPVAWRSSYLKQLTYQRATEERPPPRRRRWSRSPTSSGSATGTVRSSVWTWIADALKLTSRPCHRPGVAVTPTIGKYNTATRPAVSGYLIGTPLEYT